MKRIALLITICLAAPVLFAQTYAGMSDEEVARYLFSISGADIGNVHFSDSSITKIGDILIHIRLSGDESTTWYNKYGLDYLKERYDVDASNDDAFSDLKRYSVSGYRDAQIRYSEFVDKRVKGIPQYSKNKSKVEQLLSDVSTAGGVEKLFLLTSFNSPVYFTSYKNTITPLLSAVSTNKLNIRRPQEERILHVLREEVIPVLSCFPRVFDNTTKYYGVSYTYVSDYLSGDDFNAQGETISVIAPAQTVAAYKNLTITQEDLLKACELYYVNSRNKEVRKISYESLL